MTAPVLQAGRVVCIDCGRERKHKAKGRCSGCATAMYRTVQPVEPKPKAKYLTEKEIASLRRMVGWREEWSSDRPRRDPDVVAREETIRAWFAAEGIDPLQRLPRGTTPRVLAAVGCSGEAFDWVLRRIRGQVRDGRR